MVTLSAAEPSNASIATSLPSGMVAVFVGGTSGIGGHALRSFAEQARSPTIYPRRPVAGSRRPHHIRLHQAESRRTVHVHPVRRQPFEQCCAGLRADSVTDQEYQSPWLTDRCATSETTEGLYKAYVLPVTSRILFSLCLLPALQRAAGLRRVVSVFAAGHEGPFDETDWAGYCSKHPIMARGHTAAMITMAHNTLAGQESPGRELHPQLPGRRQDQLWQGCQGLHGCGARGARAARAAAPQVPLHRGLYGATSAAIPPANGAAGAGVPLSDGMPVSVGADGRPGSGSYNLDAMCERASDAVQKRLGEAKESGAENRLWAHIMREIKEITDKDY
ncbi:hypothetical protein LLEC1_03107 [Akanthomyces lecanii]|uniref:Uncharacterized protein n=1 Tax=Cordyceps confragosa TaxID=2714763 RepID=A0A179IAV8_CORDF|nr:hypothetical protein LLEC1_03107 [Akanthomyces lecanii]